MNSIHRRWVLVLFAGACLAVLTRAVRAISDLMQGDETAFLAFPLTVLLPALAFAYLGQLRNMVSQEGALMQLGVMIQLLLILALPSLALYLALGFPVVFLVVELFETKAPPKVRDLIKRQLLS